MILDEHSLCNIIMFTISINQISSKLFLKPMALVSFKSYVSIQAIQLDPARLEVLLKFCAFGIIFLSGLLSPDKLRSGKILLTSEQSK